MNDTSAVVARQLTCPFVVHTCESQDGREPPGARPKGALGYRFSAVPQSLWDKIHEHTELPPPSHELPEKDRRKVLNDRLRPVDADVLGVMLNFRFHRKDSCWCSKAKIAEKIGKTAKTVQMSIRRLSVHGFIEQVPVEAPDPDDPRNQTGWRIVFLFVPEVRARGLGPDRRPWTERTVWVRAIDGGEKPVSSPPLPLFEAPVSSEGRSPVSSEGRSPVSSKYCAGASKPDGTELDGETPPSSSSIPAAPDDEDDVSGTGIRGEEAQKRAAIEAVRKCMPPERCNGADAAAILAGDADQVVAEVKGSEPWGRLEHAAYMALGDPNPIRRPKRWLIATANNFPPAGPSAESRDARARFLEHERQQAAVEAQKRANAQPAPAVAAPTIARQIAELESEIQGTKDLAQSNLVAAIRRMAESRLPELESKLQELVGRAEKQSESPVRA